MGRCLLGRARDPVWSPARGGGRAGGRGGRGGGGAFWGAGLGFGWGRRRGGGPGGGGGGGGRGGAPPVPLGDCVLGRLGAAVGAAQQGLHRLGDLGLGG